MKVVVFSVALIDLALKSGSEQEPLECHLDGLKVLQPGGTGGDVVLHEFWIEAAYQSKPVGYCDRLTVIVDSIGRACCGSAVLDGFADRSGELERAVVRECLRLASRRQCEQDRDREYQAGSDHRGLHTADCFSGRYCRSL